jgi:hypothetical protein
MTIGLLRHATTAVWVLLVMATGISWWLGHGESATSAGLRTASVAIIVLAFVKVRLIGLHFMELRTAPMALRAAFEAYVIVVGGLLLAFYLTA